MPTRERSPNYPAYGLPNCIEFLQQLYTKERRSPISMEAAARAIGSESLSGPARSKIAALRQYGLVDNVASGKIRVSDRSMALILRKPGDEEFVRAAREAAQEPSLFHTLLKEYGDASDDNIAYHLITERQFSEDGAKRVIRSFRDTMSFANLGGPSYNERNDEVSNEEFEGTERTTSSGERVQRRDGVQRTPSGSDAVMSYTWPLPDDIDAHIAFHGHRPTRRAIERLIAFLQFMKEDLPEPTAARGTIERNGTAESDA